MSPLPGSVGWGVNVWTGALTHLPVVKLTYTDKTRTWQSHRLPVEAKFVPVQEPEGVPSEGIFSGMNAFETSKNTMRGGQPG